MPPFTISQEMVHNKEITHKKMSADIFSNTILCGKCHIKMKPIEIEKNGFVLRAVSCPNCTKKIIHPEDEQEFEQFSHLKNKVFKVKMRIVGNSYAVSIPKEIVSFIQEQEKIMDNMVSMCFDNARRLNLMFGDSEEDEED